MLDRPYVVNSNAHSHSNDKRSATRHAERETAMMKQNKTNKQTNNKNKHKLSFPIDNSVKTQTTNIKLAFHLYY